MALLLSLATVAAAQTPPPLTTPPAAPSTQEGPALSLNDVIRAALAHNPGLQAARRLREQAEAGVQTAGALPNPRLELSQGQNEARVPSAVPGAVRGWALAQFIENPAARSARVEAARATERGSVHQIAATLGLRKLFATIARIP